MGEETCSARNPDAISPRSLVRDTAAGTVIGEPGSAGAVFGVVKLGPQSVGKYQLDAMDKRRARHGVGAAVKGASADHAARAAVAGPVLEVFGSHGGNEAGDDQGLDDGEGFHF